MTVWDYHILLIPEHIFICHSTWPRFSVSVILTEEQVQEKTTFGGN
jgi:hypothetical protein